ncbi:hypothetical protein [Nocardioides sp. Root190]|uniref:hypothetical protein n=1 Tax=Nocardioides sp. Root190 TaxID=1736488 RepID=UPI0012FCBDCD|nr:hypothetical protein [Nocardioides sp. Root190]
MNDAFRGDPSVAVVPVDGFVTMVRFDGQSPVVWWGAGPNDTERLAIEGRRIAVWSSPEECLRTVLDRGWSLAADDDGVDSTEVTELDFEPAQAWLRGSSSFLDPDAGLNMWNFAIDVSASLRMLFRQRGQVANRCHDKLTAANIPWAWGLESYVPRWTPAELRVLRRVLGEAVHVIRSGLSKPH